MGLVDVVLANSEGRERKRQRNTTQDGGGETTSKRKRSEPTPKSGRGLYSLRNAARDGASTRRTRRPSNKVVQGVAPPALKKAPAKRRVPPSKSKSSVRPRPETSRPRKARTAGGAKEKAEAKEMVHVRRTSTRTIRTPERLTL